MVVTYTLKTTPHQQQQYQQPSYGLQHPGAPRPNHNTNNPYSALSGSASSHGYQRPSQPTSGSAYAATIPGPSPHSAHGLARPLPSASNPNAIYYADPSSGSKYSGPAAAASSPYGLHSAGTANGTGVGGYGGEGVVFVFQGVVFSLVLAVLA